MGRYDVMMTVTNNAMMVMTETWFLAPLTQWCDFALPHLYNWPSPSHLTLLEPWNQLNTWWMMMMLWDDDDVGDVWCYDKVMMKLWWCYDDDIKGTPTSAHTFTVSRKDREAGRVLPLRLAIHNYTNTHPPLCFRRHHPIPTHPSMSLSSLMSSTWYDVVCQDVL